MSKQGVLINFEETFIVGIRFGKDIIYMEVGVDQLEINCPLGFNGSRSMKMGIRVVRHGIEEDEAKKLMVKRIGNDDKSI